MEFLDYNRTIVGFHGTRLSTALAIVKREQGFTPSTNSDDWLGHGIYFWEHAPKQALWWAERRQKRHNWGEPVAVLGSMIRLGNCLDLLEPQNVDLMDDLHDAYVAELTQAGLSPPVNANQHKYLDCAVFQYAYPAIEPQSGQIDTSRGVYVRTGKDRQGRKPRVWKRSWIVRDAHIQICVRNPACILGTWLETVP
jgi:hypothetical protein